MIRLIVRMFAEAAYDKLHDAYGYVVDRWFP